MATAASAATPPFFVDNLAGCRREDLILLTPDERRRCDNRIAAARRPGWTRDPLACTGQNLRGMAADDRLDCDRRLAELHASGAAHPVDPLPARKRAYYDAVRQAYEEVRKGVPRTWYPEHDGPPIKPSHGFDINVGFHMKCQAGAPSSGVRAGRLPCTIHPPRGFGTEEWGIEPP
jgi:hypothetical protein